MKIVNMNREYSEFESNLSEIGLTSSEIKVYIALLELGPATIGPIVSRSETADSKIYVVLDKLIRKGMASGFMQGGVRHFKAAPPSQILSFIKEKKMNLSTMRGTLKI